MKTRRARTLWSFLAVAACGAVGLAPAGTGAVEEPPATTITVDPSQAAGPVDPLLFGVNHRYGYDAFGSFDPDADRVFPRLADRVREAKASSLRYPGGTISNLFHWKRAVGPPAERGCQTHGSRSSGEPLDSRFGPDEHARFAASVGAQTTIVVNFATGTPAEAADWVEYMNAPVGTNPNGGTAWADVRARNGHPSPYNVRWWEVGNEMNGTSQSYWMGTGDVQERARKYALGGTTSFDAQPVGVGCDQQAEANLSTGEPGQRFDLYYPPVVEDSQSVQVDGTAWSEVTDLESAGPSDQVYTFEPSTGRITFGDGVHGAVPPAGAAVTASYTSGPHDGYVDFAKAMQEVDPRIRVCSAFTDPAFLSAMGDRPLDCQTVHRYANFQDAASAVDAHDTAMVGADASEEIVSTWQQRLDELSGDRAAVVLTEYGMYRGGYTGSEHYLRSLDGALQMASMLAYWIRLDVDLAQKHSLVDFDPDNAPPGSEVLIGPDQSMFGWAPSFVRSASAHVLDLYTHMTGGQVVRHTIAGNPIREGVAGDYPALLVTSTKDANGNLYLVVINRDPDEDVLAHVDHLGFRNTGSAAVWTVNGPQTFSFNSPGAENVVSLDRSRETIGADGFDHSFPAHSVTGIRLNAG